MTNTTWSNDLRSDPSGHSSGQKPARPTAGGRPAWAQLSTAGIMIYLLGWVLHEVMPAQGQLDELGARISPYTVSIAVGLWIAAGVTFLLWLPARLRQRSHGASGEAERVAIADELKVPAEHVSVTVKTRPDWRPPFWRLRKVIVWLPRGKVSTDPSKRLSARLQPLLGAVHKRAWKPRQARLVLTPGEADPDQDDEVEIPDAESDPQKRAVQVSQGILKTDQLRTEPITYDEQGYLTAFKVRHPTNIRVAGTEAEKAISERMGMMMPDAPGERGWSVTVNPQLDYLMVRSRTPMPKRLPHPVLDYAHEFGDKRFIPFGLGESNRYMGWDISASTQCPHCLLVGSTGSGKTSTIRSVVVGATRQSGQGANQIEVWGLDPKMIELMGLEGWPGVTKLAFVVEEMAGLIEAAHAEMTDRYARIRRREIHPSDLPALVIILDEFFILRAQLMRWWKEDLGNKGQPPHLTMLNEMLALARSAAVYLCLGIQRPDASHFDDGARDNMRTRVAHNPLSEEARKMMWGHPSKGVMTSSGVRGRAMASDSTGEPEETQQFWTPDLDQHPLPRQHMSEDDKQLIDALRPEPFTPYTITKSGLYVPNTDSREVPSTSSQAEMMDEAADIIRVRDLAPGDRIKYDNGGRWELAVVEQNSYEQGDDQVDLDVVWDNGGGGETLSGLADNDEIYCVERVHAAV